MGDGHWSLRLSWCLIFPVISSCSRAALTDSVVLQLLVSDVDLRQPGAEVGHAGVLEVVGDLPGATWPATCRGLFGSLDHGLGRGSSGQECSVSRAVEGGVTMLSSKYDHRLKYQKIKLFFKNICCLLYHWLLLSFHKQRFSNLFNISLRSTHSNCCVGTSRIRLAVPRRAEHYNFYEIKKFKSNLTYKRQLLGLGTWGSERNFLSIIVHVSATTFIFSFSMNFASSPHTQASRTVSDTEIFSFIQIKYSFLRISHLYRMNKSFYTTSPPSEQFSRQLCSKEW